MTAPLIHVGTLSLGECVPFALLANAHLKASLGLVLPSLQAQLQGLLDLQLALTLTPPSIAGNISVLLELIAGLQASLTLGLPGIDFQFAAVLELLAKLQLDLGSLSLSVDFGLEFDLILGSLGIDMYVYEGPVNQLGDAATRALAGGLPGGAAPTQACNAILLATSSPVTASALAKFFRSV